MNRIDYILLILIALFGLLMPNVAYTLNNDHIISNNTLKNPEEHVIGSNNYGMVTKSGPYGNPNATHKIAFIVGVHPMEGNAHWAIITSVISLSKSLNSSYYIYNIDVSENESSYNNGRQNGQLLANEYVVSDIEKNNFSLAIDVHSNRGYYQEKRFICAPIEDNRSKSLAYNIEEKIPWLVYYLPPKDKGPSSPNYVTVPLIKSGTPALVYETYLFEPADITVKHAIDFIRSVDNIKFN